MAAARAALPIHINVCSVSLDQDLADLLAQLQDEFGQLSFHTSRQEGSTENIFMHNNFCAPTDLPCETEL